MRKAAFIKKWRKSLQQVLILSSDLSISEVTVFSQALKPNKFVE